MVKKSKKGEMEMPMTTEEMNKVNSGELEIPHRKEVISYMHYNGENHNKLSKKDYYNLFYLADGFGKLDPNSELAINIGYDWSHVRDSSPKAIRDIYDYIKREVL